MLRTLLFIVILVFLSGCFPQGEIQIEYADGEKEKIKANSVSYSDGDGEIVIFKNNNFDKTILQKGEWKQITFTAKKYS